jgi:protein phosphatase
VNDALALKPDLKPEEIARLPRNIITRALGMKDLVKVDVRSEVVELGDTFLLCSDGLSGMVTDNEILEIITITDDIVEACDLPPATANDAGGTDNITAILVRFDDEAAPMRVRRATSSPDSLRAAPIEPAIPNPPLAEVVAPDIAAALVAGAEVDLSTPSSIPPKIAHCRACHTELIVGNSFCVECGTPIEEHAH